MDNRMNTAEYIRSKLIEAYRYARQASEKCYDNLGTGEASDYPLALKNAALCTACFSTAAAYLLGTEAENDNTIAILKQFEVVVKEIRTVYHQIKKNTTALYIELDYLEKLLISSGFDI